MPEVSRNFFATTAYGYIYMYCIWGNHSVFSSNHVTLSAVSQRNSGLENVLVCVSAGGAARAAATAEAFRRVKGSLPPHQTGDFIIYEGDQAQIIPLAGPQAALSMSFTDAAAAAVSSASPTGSGASCTSW